jgi:hypothetical protein
MSFLHLTRWRIALLAVVTVVALAAAGGLALRRSRQYTASTTAFVGRVLAATNADVTSSVTDFETVVRLPSVTTAVAKQTGVAPATVANKLSFARVGTSSAVRVSFKGPSPQLASSVVTGTSHAALAVLAQQQVDAATGDDAAAQRAATSAQQALTEYNQSLGVADVQLQYTAEQQDVFDLESQLASAGPGQVQLLNSLIALRTQQLAQIGAALPRYNQLSDALTQATDTLHLANQALTQAEGKLDAANSPTIVTAPDIVKQSRLGLLARAFVATGVAVILLGLLAFFLVDHASQGAPEPTAPDYGAPLAQAP